MAEDQVVSIGDHDIVFTRNAALELLYALADLYGYQLVPLEKPPNNATIN